LSGDTLPALSARFGVPPEDIVAPNGLRGTTTLAEGQLLVIPQTDLGERTSEARLIPDSELIYSGSAAGFDPEAFADEWGGYLAGYSLFADGLNRDGGDVVLLVGQHHSVNPRLLTALLEYNSGWVTNPGPVGDALAYPMGYVHPYRRNLYAQLYWAAAQLSTGYYGWRAGTLTELRFPDGSTLRLEPTLNAGTVALLYYFAQMRTRPQWDADVGPGGFMATYQKFFGDPWARAMNSLIPADLTQPPLALPFLPGHTWYFSGGPHGAWLHGGGGAMAALDFAPGALEGGCAESLEWVTAVAAGKIVRVDHGSVLLDLDGDGREATGWVILYLHVGAKERVAVGAVVEMGDRLGHPSCEGGTSTGTHVHIARKYNGEWIPADGVVPFNLSGWVAHNGSAEYLGALTRDGQIISACTCTAAWTAITADP
jgi:murein DD-endopeptidase MepM/ murein hydrolase activator NlpD